MTEADKVLDLSDFDDDFGEAEIVEWGTSEVPDGKYKVKIDKVSDFELTDKGTTRWSLFLKIVEGKQSGRYLFKNYWLNKTKSNYKDALKYLKTDLAMLGLKVASLSEVNEQKAELLDKYVMVQKKTSGEFTNVYINELTDASEEGSEDVPF